MVRYETLSRFYRLLTNQISQCTQLSECGVFYDFVNGKRVPMVVMLSVLLREEFIFGSSIKNLFHFLQEKNAEVRR